MGIEGDVYNISVTARWLLVCATNLTTMFFIVFYVLEKRRSPQILYIYLVAKLLIINIFVNIILLYFYSDSEWVQAVNITVVCVAGIFNYVILYYTFDGGLLKISLVACVAELITIFWGYSVLGIFNFLESRDDLWELSVGIHWMDVGIPVVQIGVLVLAGYCFRMKRELIRKYEVRHRRILWILAIAYPLIATITSLLDARKNTLAFGGGITAVFMSGLTIIIFLIVKKYQSRVRKEQGFLDLQCRIMETHYVAVQRQIYDMEKSQALIDEQMKNIMQMEQRAADNGKIKSYLNDLKQMYQDIQAGMYGDDWMLDSVIYMQEKAAKRQGVRLEYSIEIYDTGKIERLDIVQIFMVLLEFGIQVNEGLADRWVQLSAAAVKNQLVIELKNGCNAKSRLFKGMLKEYLKKYQGRMMVNKSGNRFECVLFLRKN